MVANVSICVRAGLPKPRGVHDTERTKDTKTLDYASTLLDANTLLGVVPLSISPKYFLNFIKFLRFVPKVRVVRVAPFIGYDELLKKIELSLNNIVIFSPPLKSLQGFRTIK